MDIQRLRNLTTGRLHTSMGDIYEDMELITGEQGIMTHMLPRVAEAILPWLKANVTEERFWDGKYDPSHTGEYDLPEASSAEKTKFWGKYKEMPSPYLKF
jgi:hypothetical protein